MKLKYFLYLAVMLTALCSPCETTASSPGRCAFCLFDSDGFVNVRKSPSTSSPVVSKLYVNEDYPIYITPCGNKNWYRVSKSPSGGYLGYIFWNRVDLQGELAEMELSCVVTDPDGYTNIRQLATTQSKIVGTMKTGKHFIGVLVEDASNWVGVLEKASNSYGHFQFRLIGFVHKSKIKWSYRYP